MYFFRQSLSTFIAVLAFVCLTSRPANAEPVRDTEIEVYAAFINYVAKELPPSKSLVIESTTTLLSSTFTGAAASEIKARIPEASEAAISDIVRVGAQSIPLDIPKRLVRREIHYSMADEKLIREIFESNSLAKAWKRFYSLHPSATGLIRFSRVGIDVEKKQALLYVAQSCGGLCGSGYIVLLQLQWGRWEVIRNERLWVS